MAICIENADSWCSRKSTLFIVWSWAFSSFLFHCLSRHRARGVSKNTTRQRSRQKILTHHKKIGLFSLLRLFFFPTQNTASRNRRISETIDRRTWPTQRLPCYIIFLFLPHSRRRQRILYIEPRYILSRLRYIFVAHFVWFMASHWSFFFSFNSSSLWAIGTHARQ